MNKNIIRNQIWIPSVNWLWRTQELGLQFGYVVPQHLSFWLEDADPLYVLVQTSIILENAIPSVWVFIQSSIGYLFLQPVARKVKTYLSKMNNNSML